MKALHDAGATYLQLDEVAQTLLCDQRLRDAVKARGDDPERLIDLYIDLINRIVRERPPGMTIGVHMCRGNAYGKWIAAGGYEHIAEKSFTRLEVDAFFLEFDSERAGGFEPLRYIPKGKRVVIGAVSTKVPALESKDELKLGDFDLAEMSMSTLMMAVAAGDQRWVGLPIFTTRKLFHTEILVRRAAKIEKPADLKGKRVGVPEYQQTAALWTRGALEHEFGVHARDMEWWMERVPSHSHRSAVGFEAPPGVTIRQVPAEKNLGGMIVAGEIDAIVHYIANPNLVDRSRLDLAKEPSVRPLFPDPVAEGVRYYKKTGLLPINHGMVVKRSLHERHPWVV